MKPRSNQKPISSPQRRLPAHELFPQPGVYRPQSFHRPKNNKDPHTLLWGVIFLCLLVIGFGLFGWLRRPQLQAPYLLVELRALEENGHPVAAAKVSINNKSMGVTDSFGEWRRYMRLKSGEQLAIELVKSGHGGGRGKKILRVPSFRDHDNGPEVRATIELRSRSQKSLVQKKAVPRLQANAKTRTRAEADSEIETEADAENTLQGSDEPDFGMVTMPDAEAVPRKAQPEYIESSDDENDPGDTNDASLGIYFEDGLSAIAVRSVKLKGVPSNLLEKHQGEILQEKIVPLLASDLQKLGLRVDAKAPWKLSLQYIPKEDQVGYIKAQISWQNPFGQDEQTAFIAGFAKTFDETVRALSSLLRVHMKKSYWASKENGRWYIDEPEDTKAFWRLRPGVQLADTNGLLFPIKLAEQREGNKRWQLQLTDKQPCHTVRQRLRCLVSTQSMKESPPLLGWQKRRMNIQGSIPKNAEVFIAGFQATAKGDGRWEYWGHPGSNHKALLVSQGKIVHSEVFVDHPTVQTVLRVAPNPNLRQARR